MKLNENIDKFTMNNNKLFLQNANDKIKWMKRIVTGIYSRNRGVPKTHTDIEFVCLDGTVEAHKALLTEFCTTIWLLVDGQDTQFDAKVSVVIPDYSVEVVTNFLTLLYTGSVNVNTKEDLDEVQEFGCKNLGFTMTLNWFIVDPTKPEGFKVEKPWSIGGVEDMGEESEPEHEELASDQKEMYLREQFRKAKALSLQAKKAAAAAAAAAKAAQAAQEANATSTTQPSDSDPLSMTVKKLMALTDPGRKDFGRQNCNSTGSMDDDDSHELLEPDCVVDEQNPNQPNWKFNYITEEKYSIKKDDSEYGFKYVLDAPTSLMVKVTDDRLTYINMNKFYDLYLEYKPDPEQGAFKAGAVKSTVYVLFRGRHSEDEELKAWQYWHAKQTSSGYSYSDRRILEADLGNSFGIIGKIEQKALNCIEFYWNPSNNPARIAIAVQCLSTDFSDQKGVKGQPLHVQCDTIYNVNELTDGKVANHRGYCQIKVFRDKGAQRKLRDEQKQAEKWKTRVVKFKANTLQEPSERSEFHYMADLCKPPFVYHLGEEPVGGSQSPKLPIPSSFGLQGDGDDMGDVEASAAKRARLDERIMIYVKQAIENTYSPLHVAPPTIEGLTHAIKTKYRIDPKSEIGNVFRRNKHGAIVQFDDEMIKFFSHEGMFIVQLAAVQGQAGKSDTIYDITFTEAL